MVPVGKLQICLSFLSRRSPRISYLTIVDPTTTPFVSQSFLCPVDGYGWMQTLGVVEVLADVS